MKLLVNFAAAVIALSSIGFSQSISGTVTEIIDGQLVVIEASHKARFTVSLAEIEMPTEDQPFFEIVSDHVSKMVLGKIVRVDLGSSYSRTGTVFLGDTDLRMQLLRDGAAWYVPSDPNAPDGQLRENETLARNERRGIWSIDGFKSPSELRAIVQLSPDFVTDPHVAAIARTSLGPNVEGVFGEETYSTQNSECSGQVIGIVDGDTVKIRNSQNQTITVRLAGIDAPEKSQAFGQNAKQHLSSLIFGKTVGCSSNKKDRYGRMIGKITFGGKDINLAMIEGCLAWHYKDYEREQTESDRVSYANAERSAKSQSCGLWGANPIKPSDFRKQRFVAAYRYHKVDSDSSLMPGPRNAGPMYPYLPPILVESSSSQVESTLSPSGAANRSSPGTDVDVRGYTRKDGTYIRPHTRSWPGTKRP